LAGTQPLDTLASQTLTFDQLRPYFSSNYATPLPIAHITYSVGAGHPLSGIVQTPGLPTGGFTDVQPKMVAWRLAAFEAVKHAVAGGASLAAMQLDVDNSAGAWRSLQVLPSSSVWPARQPAARMSDDQVKTAVSDALPAWAKPMTSVSVSDDYVGERVVTATLALPLSAFAAENVRALPDSLAAAQGSLSSNGGDVGRTLVTITDPTSGDPLYTAGDDRLWGYSSEWISPLVSGLPGFEAGNVPSAPSSPPPIDTNGIQSGITGSPAPWTPPLASPPPQR
jgi:hypothetical protein